MVVRGLLYLSKLAIIRKAIGKIRLMADTTNGSISFSTTSPMSLVKRYIHLLFVKLVIDVKPYNILEGLHGKRKTYSLSPHPPHAILTFIFPLYVIHLYILK